MLNACGIASWRPQNHCILMLISLIPLSWSLFNQTHYVCGRQGCGAQRCPVLVPRICYLTWPRNASNGIQALELVMGAGFQGGCHLITWALKQRIFSVKGQSGRCGGREEVWTWAWRAVGGSEAGGGDHDSRNAGGLWPGGMGPAGSQWWYRDLSPPAAREWIL